MATVSYQGTSYTITSGVFLCCTTANPATSGSQNNGVYLRYKQSKKVKWYRNSSTVVFMGRGKPATEVGQYQFRGVDLQYSYPPNGTDITGAAVTAAQIETAINNMVTNLQAGQYIELQDAKGRVLYGTFSQDPELSDEVDQLAGWQTLACSFVEVA